MRYSIRYPAIRKTQVAYACEKSVRKHVASTISDWIPRVTSGELSHCEPVLGKLFVQLVDLLNRPNYPRCSTCETQFTGFPDTSMVCSSCGGHHRSLVWNEV